MLDKPQYESWKSRMELYIQGKDHGRIILNLVENGPLVWPTVELENDTVRPKTYEELFDKEKLQADYDLKDTNIVLQGLPPDVYALVNHHKVAKDIWDRVKMLMQGTSLSNQERECKLYDEFDKFSYVKGLVVPTFLPGDDPISCMNKVMAFLSAVFTLCYPLTNNQLRSSSNLRNQAIVKDGEGHMARHCTQLKRRRDASWFKEKFLLTDDLDAYDSDYDDISSAKAVLMANLSSCDSDVLSEDKANNESKIVNESLTAELERYKERVKILEQRFNVDLSGREKFIDSQMDDMIRMKNTKFAAFETEIDTLKQALSKHVKEKESLLIILNGFKTEFKEIESKSIDKEIILENKNKELENIVSEDFGKHFVPQQELFAEQKFWFQSSDKNSEEPSISNTPVKIEVQNELPKVFANASLKNELRKLKGKNVIDTAVLKPYATTIAPGMFKLNLEPLALKVLKNKDAHPEYIKHSREHADILQEIVKSARVLSPLDSNLDSACKFTWVKFLKSKDEALEFIINYYEDVGISHETSVARTPQQNSVVERRNCTLVEAAHTMLIYAKALLFLWTEAVATACYTQNRSLIYLRHGKTPYELLHDRKPNLSYLYVFGALCYPTNDNEDLGKLEAIANVDILPQPLFDEYFRPPPCVDHPVPEVAAVSTGSPSLTSVDQDEPSPSTSETPQASLSHVITPGAEEADHDIEVSHMDNNPQFGILIPEPISEDSSSQVVIPNNVHSVNQPPKHM
ncbi:retrovirus-related pol polyprotein from transposon TNT 1-94 [Tanacetum coccineum]